MNVQKDRLSEMESAIASVQEQLDNTQLLHKNAMFRLNVEMETLQKVNNEQWALMTEIEEPSMALLAAMGAVLALIGHDDDAEDTVSWQYIRGALLAENADILMKMIQFKVSTVSNAATIGAQSIMQSVHSVDSVDDVAANGLVEGGLEELTVILRRWVDVHIECATFNGQCEELQNQIITQTIDRNAVNQEIVDQEAVRNRTAEQRDRSLCRVDMLKSDLQSHAVELEEQKESVDAKLVPSNVEYRPSIRNYLFVQCGNDIVSIHPVNPTFEFLNVANLRNGSSFCNSRQYGTFFVTHNGTAIAQSATFNVDNVHLVYRCGVGHQRWNHCFAMDPADDFKADNIHESMSSLWNYPDMLKLT